MIVKELIDWLNKLPQNGTVSFMTIDSALGPQFFYSLGAIESDEQEIVIMLEHEDDINPTPEPSHEL